MESSDKDHVLTLSGALTIDRAGEVRAALLDALDSWDEVVLNLEKVTEIDLSFLQILCSAHRSSLIRHKRLVVSGKKPEALERMADEAGFKRNAGCELDSLRCCLWTGGLK